MASEEIHRQITDLSAAMFRGLNLVKDYQDDLDGILASVPPADPIHGPLTSARAQLNTAVRQLTKSAQKISEQIDSEPPAP